MIISCHKQITVLSCFSWLHKLLSRIVVPAKTFLVNASRTKEDINQRKEEIINRLEAMVKGQEKVIKDLQQSFDEQVNNILHRLSVFLSSEDVKARFALWSGNEFPDQYISALTPEVEEKIATLLSSRFEEFVVQWEEEHNLFANARLSLVEKFTKQFGIASMKLNFREEISYATPPETYILVLAIQKSFGFPSPERRA